jgi:hypothetical protein
MAEISENKTEVSHDKLTGSTGGRGGSPMEYWLVSADFMQLSNFPQPGVVTGKMFYIRGGFQNPVWESLSDEFQQNTAAQYRNLWIRSNIADSNRFINFIVRTSYDPPTADGE